MSIASTEALVLAALYVDSESSAATDDGGIPLSGLTETVSSGGQRLSQQVEITVAVEKFAEEGVVWRETVDGEEVVGLTQAGNERARTVREQVGETEIELVDGGNEKELTLEDAAAAVGRSMVDLAAACSDDGVYYREEGAPAEDLIGRDSERERVEKILEQVREDRHGEVVILSGPGGIGKTTLADTLLEETRAFVDVIRTRCREAGGEPYQPIRDALAQLDSEDVFVSANLNADDAESYEAQQTALFHEITEHLTPGDGVRVLFLDDIDLADADTWTYLSYLGERLMDLPLVILGTHRPDALPENTPLTADRLGDTPITRIELTGLSLDDTERLIGQVMNRRGVPDAFVEAVHERTDGNPLFVETTVETLLDRNQLDPQFQWYPDDAEEIDLPDAVRETIVQQLGTLDGTTRELLEWAAVAGEAVPLEVLEAVVDAPKDRVGAIVDTLIEAGTFIEEGTETQRRVTLRSNVVREAVLEKLDGAEKRRKHEAIAWILEGIVSLERSRSQETYADQAATIAYHHERAADPEAAIDWYREAAKQATDVYAHETATEHYHRVLDLARSADMEGTILATGHELAEIHLTISDYEQASRYVQFVRERTTDEQTDYRRQNARLAAEIAVARGAFDDAIEQAQNGLELTEEWDTERCRLLAVKAEAEWRKSDYEAAEETCQQFRDLARDLGRTALQAEASEQLAMIFQERSEFDQARDHYEDALEKAEAIGDDHHAANIRNGIGIVADRSGNQAEARRYYERALETFEKVGDRHQAAKLYNNLAAIYGNEGDHEREREYYERALETGEAVGDRDLTAVVRLNLAAIFDRHGEYEKGRESTEAALESWREAGDDHRAAIAMLNRGIQETEVGRFDEARDYLEEALAVVRDIGDEYHEGSVLNALGVLETERGRYDQAAAYLDRATAAADAVGNQVQLASIQVYEAELARKRGEFDAAREHAEAALERVREHDDQTLLAETLQLRSQIRIELGEFDTAEDSLGEARELYGNLEDPKGTAMIERATGNLACKRGDHGRARDLLETALDVLEDLGTTPDAARTRRDLGRLEIEAGDPDAARTHLTETLETFEEIGAVGDAVWTLEELVSLAIDTGWTADLREWCDRGESIAGKLENGWAEDRRAWFRAQHEQLE